MEKHASLYHLVALPVILSAVLVSGQAHGAARYTMTALGHFEGDQSSYAAGVNANGEVVGYCGGSTGVHAFIWDSVSGMRGLGTLPAGSTTSRAFAINDAGEAVGTAANASSQDRAFIWRSGTGMEDLGQLATSNYAMDISNAGQVVGQSGSHAFIWDAEHGMQDIGSFGGQSVAKAISETGNVAGYSYSSVGTSHAFLWQPGAGMRDLGTLGGYSAAFGMNDRDQVVGYSYPSAERAFLWQESTGMIDLGVLPGRTSSKAYSINNSGQVVGVSGPKAFLWEPGVGMQDLNDLVAKPQGWYLQYAGCINDRGQIAGYGYNASNHFEAFVLTPIPEPSSLLALLGGIGLFVRARLRRPRIC